MRPPDSDIVTRTYAASDEEALPQALQALRSGQLVVFPTDTVYGVGCDLWQVEAVKRLFWAKQRPASLPVAILVSAPQHVMQVASRLPDLFAPLIDRHWPGGLSVVVPRHACVPSVLCAGKPTVAVRMPRHPLALRLIAEMGGVLAVTSANLSGDRAARTAEEALAGLSGRVAVVLDAGPCPRGVASSIVDLTLDPPVLLRRGAMDADVLRQVLPALIALGQ